MSPLRLQLRAAPEQRLDLSALVPSRLAAQDLGAIERITLNTTRQPVCVGDVFRLRKGDASAVVIEGGSERFDQIGAMMESGSLLLDGDAGMCAGRLMAGGILEIRGSVGPWAASGVRGGLLKIAGEAGDFLGGPLAGERTGMRGGTVIVHGNAGARAGDRLRRGLIIVEGRAGPHVGSRMIAGTLVTCRQAEELPGVLMRRGTLVLGVSTALTPSFVPAGAAGTVFLGLLADTLRPLSRRAARIVTGPLQRFAGDMATLGRGEVLIAGDTA